ncbi:MAG TPA: hypothetical protein VD994_17025 [Prosthecobacter sp.]|nr:hypothetical protein [Prosthecobacter sp.]
MSQTILAIDPGASGGFAYILDGSHPAAMSMPETEGDIIMELRNIKNMSNSTPVAYVEEVGGFIRGNPAPGSTMFNFGRNFGFLLGVLQVLQFRIELVRPAKWQQPLSLGTASNCASKTEWKNKLKAKAQQLYPSLKVTLNTADALLLLEYAKGRMQ